LNPSPHIIEKVVLEVNTSNMETAQKIKNNVDLFLKNELFPRLELLFDDYNLNNEIVRFEKMNMNLSVEKWDSFEELKNKIISQFEQKLNLEIQTIPDFFSENIIHEPSGNNVRRLASGSNFGNILLFFLENGFLPWYGNEEKINEVTKSENWSEIIDNLLFFKSLKELLSKNKDVVDRIIFQFPVENITALLSRVNQPIRSSSKSITTIVKKLDSESYHLFLKLLFEISFDKNRGLEVTTKKLIQRLSFLYKAGSVDYLTISKIRRLLIKLLPLTIIEKKEFFNEFNIQDIRIKKLENSLQLDSLYNEIDEVLEKTKKNKVENIYSDKTEESDKTEVKEEIKISRDTTKKQDKIDRVESNFEDKNIHIEEIEKIEQHQFFGKELAEIAVQNAGLVLLHPFMKRFFLELNLIDERNQLTRKELAVQTLHYLATGRENVFEGNLVFEKFLSGIPLQTPVQRQSMLTDQIKNEAITLLNEVIKNWPALKNTSPDGLRQMFIQREGKLIQKEDNNFKLIVERKAQDVLLEKLNWNISILKLPWMKELVFVEW